MSGRTRLPQPNITDPLSEPTPSRRLWAYYLRAGYNRQTFASALGKKYTVVANWDYGVHAISLPELTAAAILLGLSMDDLVFGRQRPAPPAPTLAHDQVRAVLDAISATPPARAAVADHLDSPRGRYQRVTREYLTRFVAVYERELAAGAPDAVAHTRAYTEAINMRALAAAASTPVVTPARRARPRVRTRTRPPSRTG